MSDGKWHSSLQKSSECESQGPFSIPRQMYHYPILWVNGLANIAYYTGESMLYKEPLGLIFLVMASLTSTFIIRPLDYIMEQPRDQEIPPVVLVLGIIGALLCVIERKPKKEIKSPLNQSTPQDDIIINEADPLLASQPQETVKDKIITGILSTIRILIPFVMLAITYAFWFVWNKYINFSFHVNPFGYNALDQGLLPFYVFPWLFIVDYIKPLKHWYEDEVNYNESFFQSLKSWWKETSLFNTFMYRMFINGRGFAYFVLAVNYDLTLVYLELTLIRVILSWFGALVLCLLLPRFIGATPEERKATFSPWNVILKCAGTISITTGLIVLNEVY